MGYTHCFRANAAYSLYGVLKGNKDNGCTRGTYINSFFTNYGVDAFEPIMEAAGVFSEDDEDSYTAECQDGDDDNDGNDGGGYGGGTSYANKGDNMGSTSYGMSCNGNQFVTKKFRGRSCDGKDEIEVTDLLESFNEAIEQVQCVQVYSGSNGNNGDDNNNNNGDDESIASELLSSSKACSLREFPSQCPDPYGKLLRYTRALECSTGASCILKLPETRVGRDISSALLMVSGLGMLGAALFCKWHRKRGKSQMDLVRESSESSDLSKASSLSKVSSSISQASHMIVNAIQGFAEAEAAPIEQSHSTVSQGVGRTVQMQMVAINSSTADSTRSAPQTPTKNVASMPSAADAISAYHTPTKNVASMPSAAEAIDSTPSTVATFQSIKSAEDRKMAAAVDPSTYGPPPTRASRSTDNVEVVAHMRMEEEIANSMLADKQMEKQKTYKRPALARLSKRLFGGKKKKVSKKYEV
jgi:hypothetical protein